MIHTYRESKDIANALENEGRNQFNILTMYTTLPLPLPSVAKGFDSNYINLNQFVNMWGFRSSPFFIR